MPRKAQETSLPDIVREILSYVSLDWIALIFDAYAYLHKRLFPIPHGPYEILEYDSVLELCDATGRRAGFSKHQKVRFRQDNIIAYQDFVWGNGRITDYMTSHGHVADQYQEGDRWHVLISLRETRNEGDVEDLHIQYSIHEAFVQKEEWWQVEIRNPTRRLKVAIIFPQQRRCRRAILL